MINKILILALFLAGALVQTVFSQSIRPLSINILTKAHQDQAEWLWTPLITFRIVGPVESGSSLTVEYTLPDGKPFVTASCETRPVKAGETYRFDICGKDLPAAKAINQMGKFGFQIKLDNVLSGENKVLYAGKFDVKRQLYNPDAAPDKNKRFYYFLDNDWMLQFAYVGFYSTETSSNLYAQFWLKNRIQERSAITGYLFYNGKQVSETSPDFVVDSNPKENPQQEYQMLGLTFQALTEKPESDGWDGWFKVYENPGDYEIKLVRKKKLARSIKFTIGKDGKPIPNGVGKELITAGIIVPVQILGETDGAFNKSAWKDGVFGNPISGLNVP